MLKVMVMVTLMLRLMVRLRLMLRLRLMVMEGVSAQELSFSSQPILLGNADPA